MNGCVRVVSDREVYGNGNVRLELYEDGRIWLQNGMAGFWMREAEFDDMLEMLTEMFINLPEEE
jgi:hypothetical protein